MSNFTPFPQPIDSGDGCAEPRKTALTSQTLELLLCQSCLRSRRALHALGAPRVTC